MFKDLKLLADGSTVLPEDKTASIKWSKPERMAKHIDFQYHFINDIVVTRTVKIQYCLTRKILGDLITKPTPRKRSETLRKTVGLQEVERIPAEEWC